MTLLATLFIWPFMAYGEIVIRAPDASIEAFETAVYSHKGFKPWGDEHVQATAEQQKQLTTLFENAQRAFLGESLDSAQEKFKKVVAMALIADWDKTSIDAITYSFYRIAQLADNQNERARWLKEAISFRGEVAVDKANFPPPIIEAAKNEKLALEKLSVAWHPFQTFRGYEKIFINGRAIEHPDALAQEDFQLWLTPGEVRLTALSSSLPPISQVFKVEELGGLHLQRESLLAGNCQHPSWQTAPPKNADDVVAFYGPTCLKRFVTASGQWQELDKTMNLSVQPKTDATLVTPLDQPRPWYKNKWVWIGTAALASAVVVLTQKSGGSSETTTHYYPTSN